MTRASELGRALATLACLCVTGACAVHGRLGPGQARDEAAVISDLRALSQAETAYRPGNFGYYDVPECLATPARCIPWYQPRGPLLAPPTTQLLSRRHGYLWQFIPGRAPERAELPEDASRSSLLEWAFMAVPLGAPDQRPAFCVDSSPRLCRYPSREALRHRRASCPLPCEQVD